MMSKTEAHYGEGMPQSHCGICRYFLPQAKRCRKVEGEITSSMWCKLFSRKQKERAF